MDYLVLLFVLSCTDSEQVKFFVLFVCFFNYKYVVGNVEGMACVYIVFFSLIQ